VSGRRRRIGLVVAGCAALAFASVAFAAATDPKIEPVAADQAWADSIVLVPSDLGTGWTTSQDTASSGTGTGSDTSDDSGWCPGTTPDESSLTATGVSASPEFERPGKLSISSGAVVWKTADDATRYLDDFDAVMPRVLDCVADLFTSLSTKDFRVVVVSKGAIPFTAVTPRAAVYRIRVVFSAKERIRGKLRKVSWSASIDSITLGNGRATAVVFASATHRKPPMPAFEQKLATALAARMATDPAPAP
jgi:hypothetical protein